MKTQKTQLEVKLYESMKFDMKWKQWNYSWNATGCEMWKEDGGKQTINNLILSFILQFSLYSSTTTSSINLISLSIGHILTISFLRVSNCLGTLRNINDVWSKNIFSEIVFKLVGREISCNTGH